MTTAIATKKPEAATEPKISDAVKSLASVFAKSFKVEKDGTVVVDGDIVADNLPPDLDMATLKRSQKFRGEVAAAATLALGEVGLPFLAKHKDADKVHVAFKFANDKVDLALERQHQFNDGKGGKLTKYGYVSMGYTASGATNAGEFKKARQQLASEAEKLFG